MATALSDDMDDPMEVDKTQDKNIKTETSKGSDFLLTLFQRGLHQILEKIFLSLPLSSILLCQSVSSEWSEMISYYHNSENPRIQEILELRISKEWFEGRPVIESFPLAGVSSSCQDFQHIVTDDADVVVVGLYSDKPRDYGKPFIHILDAKTLRLKKLIHVRSYIPRKKHCLFFHLMLTEKYIFLSGIYLAGRNSTQYFWAAWHRQNDFAFSGHRFTGEPLPLPITNWNPGPKACTNEIILKPFFEETFSLSSPKLRVNLISESSAVLCYKVLIGVDAELLISSRLDLRTSSISFSFGGSEIWVKTKPKQVRLVGYNDEFVCVTWQNEDLNESHLEVYQINDGSMKQSFDLEEEFGAIYEAQISHGRIAVRGIQNNLDRKFEIFVFDLKTGHKLLQSSSVVEDGMKVERFVLAKDRIIFLQKLNWPNEKTTGRIFVAKFWV